MQSPDVVNAETLQEYKLLLTFANGEVKIFNMKPYLKYPVFKPLMDEMEFKEYSIIDGTVEWKCGAELSTDTFYIEGTEYNKKIELKQM